MGTAKKPSLELTTKSVESYRSADFQQAERGFSECVDLARNEPDALLDVAEALNNLSNVLLTLARYPEAKQAINEALSICSVASSEPTASSIQESTESKVLRACVLNSHARLLAEFEEFHECEAALIEAIDLVAPFHPAYAAEFTANLLRIYSHIPEWRDKIQFRAEEFDRLHSLGEDIEIFFDDFNNWRRPGRCWDKSGAPALESIKARSIIYKIKYLYSLESDSKTGYELILQLDEESRQVPPDVVVFACLSLAEIAVLSGELQPAAKFLDDALRISGSCYLRSHPGNYLALIKAGGLSLAMGAFEKAIAILDNAAKLVRGSVGEINPAYARCMSTRLLVPTSLSGDKKFTEQLKSLRECQSLLGKFYPVTHSEIIDLNLAIVNVCLQSNRFDEANELLTATLTNSKNCFDSLFRESLVLSSLTELRIKQGRVSDAEQYLKISETMLEHQKYLVGENKLRQLNHIAKHYMDAGLFPDGERVYRELVALAEPMSDRVKQIARQHLALCLIRIGKNADAGDVLGNVGESSADSTNNKSRRDELVQQSQLAWGLQAKRRFAQAQALAREVVSEAHLLMPECEESLVISLSILIEQAKREDQPDEMLRLVGVLGGYETSVRLRATMPVLYLEVAQAFAKQKSIKAEALFDKAIEAAEIVLSVTPHCLDGCILGYLNYCASNRKNEKALKLAQRLVALRANSNGTTSLEYAVALTANARLLAETDPGSAERMSLESLRVLEGMTDPTMKLQLLVTVSVRESILKKLLRFDEAAKLSSRGVELRAELDSHIAAMKASRELTN